MATLRAATTQTLRPTRCLEGRRAREQGGRGTYDTPREDQAPSPRLARGTYQRVDTPASLAK